MEVGPQTGPVAPVSQLIRVVSRAAFLFLAQFCHPAVVPVLQDPCSLKGGITKAIPVRKFWKSWPGTTILRTGTHRAAWEDTGALFLDFFGGFVPARSQ